MNPNINSGLRAIMIRRCRLVNCNQCTTPVWDVASWGKEAVGGWGVVLGEGRGYIGPSVLTPQICSEPKRALKIK